MSLAPVVLVACALFAYQALGASGAYTFLCYGRAQGPRAGVRHQDLANKMTLFVPKSRTSSQPPATEIIITYVRWFDHAAALTSGAYVMRNVGRAGGSCSGENQLWRGACTPCFDPSTLVFISAACAARTLPRGVTSACHALRPPHA
jgi:hypothetical protein